MRFILIAMFAMFTNLASADPIELSTDAINLTQQSLLVDGHNDLPWTLRSKDPNLNRYDLNQLQSRFHTDITRLRQGGVGAQFWSVYIPSNASSPNRMVKEQIDLVKRMVAKYDAFEMAHSTEEIERFRNAGKIASLIGMEGGNAIENSLEKLRELYDLGARYMTLTHNRSLAWADSCTDRPRANGLSTFGKDVVREMNRLGMLVDISHVSVETMKQSIATSAAPVIFSHSSAYAIRNHARNVPDSVLRLLPEKDGVVMVNFYSAFISNSGRGDVDTLLDHIDHIAQVAGVNHVGIGSDFDGVPELPRQLEDVSKYPYITQGLLNRGYSEADIKKILGENFMRVFKKVEAIAER